VTQREPRGQSNDETLKGVDNLLCYQKLGDIADVDKVEYTSLLPGGLELHLFLPASPPINGWHHHQQEKNSRKMRGMSHVADRSSWQPDPNRTIYYANRIA
jgi:hypothetical protein